MKPRLHQLRIFKLVPEVIFPYWISKTDEKRSEAKTCKQLYAFIIPKGQLLDSSNPTLLPQGNSGFFRYQRKVLFS
jgi:hypothetical protein